MCDAKRDHEALKLDADAWSQLPYVGLQRTYDEPGYPTHLEMRNCTCGSTLCKPVFKRIHNGKTVVEGDCLTEAA